MKKELNLQSSSGNDGLPVSPSLPQGVKNYLIDIDGTVTDDVPKSQNV
jgi:hypothetical protein